ncbi:MAG: ABC transporter substrate-binding protein [Chloroflexi bacterium]|nr:ABC transporter substrate-binding protein [Chloroflexota bacterium]
MVTGRSRLFLSTLVIFGLIAGCAPVAPAPSSQAPPTGARVEMPTAKPGAAIAAPSPSPKPAAEQPRYGGILTISASVDPVSLDIHQESTLASLEPIVSAYDGLIQHDLRTGQIIADLAEKWETTPDGMTHTFYLRKGVKWHDGTPFSTEDVRYSIERQMDPPRGVRSGRKEVFDFIERVETPNDSTVKILMKKPYVVFMAQFATDFFVIMPMHILKAKSQMKAEVLGTGPFKFKSYRPGIGVELVRNPDYFMKGFPYLDGITHYVIRDGSTRFAAFRTGRIKMTGHFAPMTASEVRVINADYPHLKTWRFAALQSPWHVFNTSRPPFNDVRVRQAVALGYDRQAAIKVIVEGAARLGTFVPPGEWGRPEDEVLKLPGLRQPKDADRAEAKRLLAEAGYPDGLKLPLLVRAVRQDQKAGELLKSQLATIGIDATIEVAETAVYNSRTQEGNFQLGTQRSVWKINDPDEWGRKLLSNASQNYARWNSKRFDDMFEEMNRSLDQAKRKAIVREMDDLLMREMPALWPFWGDDFLGTWPEVMNFASPPGVQSSMRLHDIWLSK